MIEIVTMLAIAKLRSIFPLAAHDDPQRVVRSARAWRRGAGQLWANAISDVGHQVVSSHRLSSFRGFPRSATSPMRNCLVGGAAT